MEDERARGSLDSRQCLWKYIKMEQGEGYSCVIE